MDTDNQAAGLEYFIEVLKKDIVELIIGSLKANQLEAQEAQQLAAGFLAMLPPKDAEDLVTKLRILAEKHKIIREVYNKAQRYYDKTSMLGTDIKTGKQVCLEQDARLRGLYLIGKTGSGKTTLLINLILQDILQGMGVCFFDPHGDAINDILARLPVYREQDVILLDPLDKAYAFGLNLYQCTNPIDIDESARTVSYVLQVFAKLFADGDLSKMPQMAQILRNTALTLIDNPGTTMAEIPLLLTDEDAREKLIRNVTNPQVRLFWTRYNKMKPQEQRELTQSTLNKLDEFLSQPSILHIVGQSQSTLHFRQIMDEGKILLVKLSRQHWQLTSLVGAVIIGQIANAAYSRANILQEKRRQFNLYADEYQRFSTPDFAELLTEVRKFAIATTIAHQFRGQLDQDNRGATLNAANLVIYQVSGEDAEELAKQFDHTPPAREITGQQPKRAPTREPVAFLLRSGHKDENVLKLLEYVKKAQITLKETIITPPTARMYSYMVTAEEQFYYEYQQAQQIQHGFINEGLAELDKFLYQSMTEKATSFNCPRKVLYGLSSPYNGHLFFSPTLRDNGFFFANKYIGRHDEQLNRKVRKEKLDQALDILLDTDKLLNVLRSASRNKHIHGGVFVDNDLKSLFLQGFIWSRRRDFKSSDTADMVAIWTSIVLSVCLAAHTLSKEPLLVPSGEYEPIYGPPRTYQDMENEIASRLVNPKAFTAFCKLGSREYTLSALPFKQVDEVDVVQARGERIISQTQANYCKKRIDVDTEIASRQEALMKPEKKERKTHQEDDEA